MDVLLVNAPVKGLSRHASLTPPLGLSYIASVLLQAGYDVSALDCNVTGYNPTRLKQTIEREAPRIVGISAHTETYLSGLEIAGIAKQARPETTVIVGGTHPTVMYREAASEMNVDVVVRGEGESTIVELADYFINGRGALAEINGLAYKEHGSVKVTPERPFIENLDELPLPARGQFPLPLYQAPGTLLMSRGGCPFNCSFCAVNNIWKGNRRFRSPENVVREVAYILDHEQAQDIAFADDCFTLDRRRVLELCCRLKELNTRWLCATRVDLVDTELLEKMREAGCCSIQFGVEAGSQTILDSIGKKIRLEQVRTSVRAALDAGIDVTCSFMFPHPEDTEDTVREQMRFMKELRQMGARETIAATTPYPGTYLYEHASELGIRSRAKNWNDFHGRHLMITTRNLSEETLNGLFGEMVAYVGLNLNP